MTGRRALTLMEVIIALAVLAGCAAVLSQLVDLGQRNATRAIETTEAAVACENVMQELLAGIRPWETTAREPVDRFSSFDCEIEIVPLEQSSLEAATVSVFVTDAPVEALAESAAPVRAEATTTMPADEYPVYRLVRWVFRPVSSSELDVTIPTLDNSSTIP